MVKNQFVRLLQGHVLDVLGDLPDQSIHCCVTSPPYFGLRNYGIDPIVWPSLEFSPIAGLTPVQVRKQKSSLGLEKTIWDYIGHLVLIFREIKRILRDDGTVWVNLGDSYHGGGYANHQINGPQWKQQHGGDTRRNRQQKRIKDNPEIQTKNLWGTPWRFALAMQADGWILRNDIVWAKGVSFNPVYSGRCMPESVLDRTTRAHEFIFCFAKQPKYYYDTFSVRDKGTAVSTSAKTSKYNNGTKAKKSYDTHDVGIRHIGETRNLRSVWTINPQQFPDAHFAVWPEVIADAIVKLSTSEKGCCADCGSPLQRKIKRTKNPDCTADDVKRDRMDCAAKNDCTDEKTESPKGKYYSVEQVGWERSCACKTTKNKQCTVLDPFVGAGTTALISARLRRYCIGIDINPDYIEIANNRIKNDIRANHTIWEKTSANRT